MALSYALQIVSLLLIFANKGSLWRLFLVNQKQIQFTSRGLAGTCGQLFPIIWGGASISHFTGTSRDLKNYA